jgi:hypothetical protein
MDHAARWASTNAHVLTPVDIEEETRESKEPGQLKFVSTVYTNPSTAEWIPRFFAGAAILQPIAAQTQSSKLASISKGSSDMSIPPGQKKIMELDDLMWLVDSHYRPAGAGESRWQSCSEFEEFAERYGRTEICYGNGDSKGLSLETPFGDDTVLIRLKTEQPHPELGSGLLVTLQLPHDLGESESRRLARIFNYQESLEHTFFPLIGSWCSFPSRPDMTGVAFSSFVPNFLFNLGLVPNLALWMMARANWIKEKFFPNLEDLPLPEILERRYRSYLEEPSGKSH